MVTQGRLRYAAIRTVALGATALLIPTGAALAGEGGFYAGYTASAELFDATFSKSVDNTDPNTLVAEPRRGMVFHDRSSADTVGPGARLRGRLPGASG